MPEFIFQDNLTLFEIIFPPVYFTVGSYLGYSVFVDAMAKRKTLPEENSKRLLSVIKLIWGEILVYPAILFLLLSLFCMYKFSEKTIS